MRAYEHFQDSLDYSADAAELEDYGPAVVSALLAIASALQALVLLTAVEENQNPHYIEQWRLIWQQRPSAPKPEP